MSIGWPETFALDLDLLQRLLALYTEEADASIEDASTRLGIGQRKVKGLNSWLKYLGLRDPQTRTLTSLGALLSKVDQHLSNEGTLRVLHYKLVSNQDATVWYETVNHFLADRRDFTRENLGEYFSQMGIGQSTEKHLKSDLGLFVNSYVDEHRRAFQQLGFLRIDQKELIALEVYPIDCLILGFCLFDRAGRGPRASTISISRLLREEGYPGLVFRISEDNLRQRLHELESASFLSVIRIADIDGISYSFEGSPMDFLERYFQGKG